MRCILVIAVAVVMSGCASHLYLQGNATDKQAFSSSSSVTVVHRSAPFLLQTVKSVAGSGLMADLSKSSQLGAGDQLVAQFKIKPPVQRVRDEFMNGLFPSGIAAGFKNIEVSPTETLSDGAARHQLSTAYALHFDTDMWQSSYLPLNWQTYHVFFNIKAQVIRTSDQVAIWKGFCNANGVEDEAMRLHVDEFAANNGAKLNEILAYGANKCAADLLRQFRASGSV